MNTTKDGKFRFKRLDTIGAAEAENDDAFLAECFVDTGELNVLRNCDDHRSLVVARTGFGKTALLHRLCRLEKRSILLKPDALALNYISNSTILNFLIELGVSLDVFFKLLWKHVITVELLKHHFHIDTEADKRTFRDRLVNFFSGNRRRQKAVEYLQEWGASFWEDAEYRIKEVTTKFEDEISESLGGKFKGLFVGHSQKEALSAEERAEVIQRAQTVVNRVQVKELGEILDMLGEIFTDRQKRQFIIIDRLDENWMEDRFRYRVIRALVETVREFNRVPNTKIVVALRIDLLDRVYRITRDAGFQEEKLESLYIRVQWTRAQLQEVLEKRINHLVASRYTKQPVKWSDVLPDRIGKELTLDYIFARTMHRPRDVIVFFNTCIQYAEGKPKLSQDVIRKAEGEYSRNRLRSLYDEWFADYPSLSKFVPVLHHRPSIFGIIEISDAMLGDICLDCAAGAGPQADELVFSARKVAETADLPIGMFRKQLVLVFYRVGLVGLRLRSYEPSSWASTGRLSISAAEITSETRIEIHPCYWRVFGVGVHQPQNPTAAPDE